MKLALALVALGLLLLPGAGLAQQPSALDPSLQRLRDAGGQVGSVNAVLTWNTIDDLDIQAICPGGVRLYFSEKVKGSGTLDVDRNAGQKTDAPVENILWQSAAARTYKILVNAYQVRQPVNFKVELLIDGVKVEERTGTATGGQTAEVPEFTLPYVRRP
jgi:hypothetical protein